MIKIVKMKWLKILMVSNALLFLHPLMDDSQDLCAQVSGVPAISSATARPNKKKLSTTFHTTERRVQYIGSPGDSLHFNDQDLSLTQNYSIASAGLMRGETKPDNADSGLVVIVDTNQVVGVTEANSGARNNTSSASYDAFPVIIKNSTNKNLIVGTGTTIPVTIEALDRGDNWKTIETNVANNSTGTGKIILKPGDIVAVAVPVYSGSFKTLMRVRVFDNYSESFTGYLNHSQLTEPVK